jgi:hypothetical protein
VEKTNPVPGAFDQVGELQIDNASLVAQMMARSKAVQRTAALLKGQSLEMPEQWTDAQIMNRVSRHFGPICYTIDDSDWISFVKKIVVAMSDEQTTR